MRASGGMSEPLVLMHHTPSNVYHLGDDPRDVVQVQSLTFTQ